MLQTSSQNESHSFKLGRSMFGHSCKRKVWSLDLKDDVHPCSSMFHDQPDGNFSGSIRRGHRLLFDRSKINPVGDPGPSRCIRPHVGLVSFFHRRVQHIRTFVRPHTATHLVSRLSLSYLRKAILGHMKHHRSKPDGPCDLLVSRPKRRPLRR